ncbi:MAG: NAD-dependent epimerase/dehydratase family protein, partial [Candidatus Omnitrophica bacterium]|nr:NAD-dependent epimerase/dehydratase family protein [Candidatus Omnitrophota bacterium]
MESKFHNGECTCWNCPAINLAGKVDFRACGQSIAKFDKSGAGADTHIMAECKRRPELGLFDPMSITFEECPEWVETPYGYMLKNMRVMILGIDGYLGWTLALWLGKLGCRVSGVDNFSRRNWVKERGSHSIVPISSMNRRLHAAKEVLGLNINFRELDILNRENLKEFIEEEKPEAIVHYGECPSAPYSMIDFEHASYVQHNNVIGTLGVLFTMHEVVPETSLIKLGCYDDETEILTDNGWKLFKDLKKGDLVATRSKSDRRMIFKRPKSIHKYPHKGKMYYQKNARIDLCVTLNHRMFTQKRSDRAYKELRLESVENIYRNRRVYDTSFEWNGRHVAEFTIPKSDLKIPMDLWMAFLGWYISEGSVQRRKDRPNHYRFVIKQKIGSRHIEDLENVLLDLADMIGKDLKKRKDGNCFAFSLYCKELANYLASLGKADSKYIPKEIKDLDKESLLELLFALLRGDGWKHTPGRDRDNFRYFTISKQLADDVQEIALKCGFGAIVSRDKPKGGYCVYICQTPRVHVNHGKITDRYVDYYGHVWCVNVGGDGIVLVRRNGKPVWCGNTMGEYGTPLTGRPLFEGMFPADAVLQWDGREWSMGGELTPRDPVSFYHVSKVQDTFNVYEACKYWWLRSYDVMQGVIYGVHTEQVAKDTRLRTRFDIDECFGTVINRYVAQAVIGYPLTVFGAGEQIRGFIALEDAMQCITRLIAKPPEPGQYGVVNQMSGYCSMRELAETVKRVGKKDFGLKVKIQRVENPRVEADKHPFEPIFNKLPDEFGFIQQDTLEREIRRMFELLTQSNIKERIEEKEHLILPKTWWSGEKKEVERLELLEDKNGNGKNGRNGKKRKVRD